MATLFPRAYKTMCGTRYDSTGSCRWCSSQCHIPEHCDIDLEVGLSIYISSWCKYRFRLESLRGKVNYVRGQYRVEHTLCIAVELSTALASITIPLV